MTSRRRARPARSRLVGAVAPVLACAALLAACGGSSSGDEALPDVELPALRGDATLDLADVEGPAVVNLWATWCAPCRRELPDFEAVYRERGGEVRFIGVNIADDPDDAADYLDELGVTFEQYLDRDGELTSALGTASLPITIVVDGDGAVVTRHLGAIDRDALIRAIEQASSGAA